LEYIFVLAVGLIAGTTGGIVGTGTPRPRYRLLDLDYLMV
jgi:hypothetical protein